MPSFLVVDDDRLVAQVTAQVLRGVGHEVLIAASGAAALEILRDQSIAIDLAVIDLVMPEIDGRQVANECRRIRPGVRIVLSSGYTETYLAAELDGIARDAFLAKPWRADDLLEIVDRLLKQN